MINKNLPFSVSRLVISLLLLLTGFLAFYGNAVQAATESSTDDITISGTLYLPGGDVAPSPDGYTLWLFMWEGGSASGYSFTIPAGASSVPFSVSLAPSPEVTWVIEYRCGFAAANCDDRYVDGYYNSTGTTFERSDAEELAGGKDHTGLSITLIKGNTISGAVSRSSEAPTAEEIIFQVRTSGSYQQVTIPAGSSSADFTLLVPPDGSAQWKIWYQQCDPPSCTGYYDRGYYNVVGTTWDSEQATLLPGGMDHAGINMTLINALSITGTISLPGGETVPADSSLYAGMEWPGGSSSEHVKIIAGTSSISYTVFFPEGTGLDVTVYFRGDTHEWYPRPTLDKDVYYLNATYYSVGESGNSTYKEADASTLDASRSHTGIDMTVFYGRSISGKVSPPSDDKSYYTTFVHAESGATNLEIFALGGNYSLSIPLGADVDWKIFYECHEASWDPPGFSCDDHGYAKIGYYSSTGTVLPASSATPLTGDQSYTDIDLTLFRLADKRNDVILRDRAAEWLGKYAYSYSHIPPKYTGIYGDVADGDYNADWIGQIYDDGITVGCNVSNTLYCPKEPVTKVQAVKLVMRAVKGGSYTPPIAMSQLFDDVPLSHPDVNWINQAKAEWITTGCGDGSSFCPGEVMTERAFLTMLSMVR